MDNDEYISKENEEKARKVVEKYFRPCYDETVVIDGEIIPKDKNYIVLLPRYLHNKELSAREIMYMSMVHIFGIADGEQILERLFSKQSLKRYREKFQSKRMLDFLINPENIKEETIKMAHKGKVCEWCGQECVILHKHHYPIPAKEGGTETVNICPNCHAAFHHLNGV